MTSSLIAAVNRLARRCLTAVAIVASIFGCAERERYAAPAARDPDWAAIHAAAKVGDSLVSTALLERARAALSNSSEEPLFALVKARLYGQFAEHGGLEHGRERMVSRALLARAWMERLEAEARKAGPPTDVELAAMTERHWVESDRPEALQTCHALVHDDKVDAASARVAAQKLAESLKPFSRCDDFLEHAKAFSFAGLKITAERLPPVLADGRTLIVNDEGSPVQEGPTFDLDFARAAHQIHAVGEQSALAHSSFGWHIILLESRVAAKRVPLEERKQRFANEILLERARRAVDQSIADARANTPVTVDRAAIEAIGRIRELQ